MALTAVIVSIIVLSMTGIITEFQNQKYLHDDTGKTIDMVKEEAGKVDIRQPEERRSFERFVESIPGYRSTTDYDSSSQCFDVTLEQTGDQISMDCIGGFQSKTEKVQLISIGYNARQSEGGNATIPPGGTASDYGGLYDAENGKKLLDGSRSYGMSVYDLDTDGFQYHRTYDIYDGSNGESEAERMVQDIQDIGNDKSKIVMVTTQDEPQTNRLHGDLPSEMYDLGASERLFGGPDTRFMYRSAYLMVGRPGLGKGNAYIEKYAGEEDRSPDAWVTATFKLS